MKKRKLGQRGVEPRQAQRALVQLGVASVIVILVALWQREFLADVYLRNQLTSVSWIINGSILLLFASALVRLIQSFVRYDKEERALNHFLENVTDKADIVNHDEELIIDLKTVSLFYIIYKKQIHPNSSKIRVFRFSYCIS